MDYQTKLAKTKCDELVVFFTSRKDEILKKYDARWAKDESLVIYDQMTSADVEEYKNLYSQWRNARFVGNHLAGIALV